MTRLASIGIAFASLCLLATGAAAATPPPVRQQQSPTLNAIHQRGSIRVGWAVDYPNMYRDPEHNAVVGYYVDIFNYLSQKLHVRIDWVEDNWNTMVAGLQAGRFDVTVPIALTPDRMKSVVFARPILQNPVGFVIRRADAGKYRRWQDLNNPDTRVSLTLGSDADMYVSRALTAGQIIRVRAAPDSITQLLMGRADAWANSLDALQYVVVERKDLEVLPGPPIGFSKMAFAIAPGDQAWRETLSQVSAELVNSGDLLKILRRYGLSEEYIAHDGPR